jgi:hypothetical protein
MIMITTVDHQQTYLRGSEIRAKTRATARRRTPISTLTSRFLLFRVFSSQSHRDAHHGSAAPSHRERREPPWALARHKPLTGARLHSHFWNAAYDFKERAWQSLITEAWGGYRFDADDRGYQYRPRTFPLVAPSQGGATLWGNPRREQISSIAHTLPRTFSYI